MNTSLFLLSQTILIFFLFLVRVLSDASNKSNRFFWSGLYRIKAFDNWISLLVSNYRIRRFYRSFLCITFFLPGRNQLQHLPVNHLLLKIFIWLNELCECVCGCLTVRDNWDKITDFTNGEYPSSIQGLCLCLKIVEIFSLVSLFAFGSSQLSMLENWMLSLFSSSHVTCCCMSRDHVLKR